MILRILQVLHDPRIRELPDGHERRMSKIRVDT
jgi:hypothetical protein